MLHKEEVKRLMENSIRVSLNFSILVAGESFFGYFSLRTKKSMKRFV
jgi:hypothetical protein